MRCRSSADRSAAGRRGRGFCATRCSGSSPAIRPWDFACRSIRCPGSRIDYPWIHPPDPFANCRRCPRTPRAPDSASCPAAPRRWRPAMAPGSARRKKPDSRRSKSSEAIARRPGPQQSARVDHPHGAVRRAAQRAAACLHAAVATAEDYLELVAAHRGDRRASWGCRSSSRASRRRAIRASTSSKSRPTPASSRSTCTRRSLG